jgi:hypothetical protein
MSDVAVATGLTPGESATSLENIEKFAKEQLIRLLSGGVRIGAVGRITCITVGFTYRSAFATPSRAVDARPPRDRTRGSSRST